ncbi:MAG: transglycosylase SLT domain-containing protein [Pseudomonadota bacterium]
MKLLTRHLLLALLATIAAPVCAAASDAGPAVSARNSPQAVADLCHLARRGDAESQYELAFLYAHGRGADRHDDWAAYLFTAASLQGHVFAEQMLRTVTWPVATAPPCFKVASALPPASAAFAAAPPHIERLVRKLAPQYQVSPQLALAIIAVESNFDVTAVSPKAAMGLMQLIPQTAKRFGVVNPFDAQQNISGGLAYLRWLLAYYEGDVVLVAAAYNAGEGAVNLHRGIPPFEETREYVKRVMSRFGHFTQPFDARITSPSPQIRVLRKHGKGR